MRPRLGPLGIVGKWRDGCLMRVAVEMFGLANNESTVCRVLYRDITQRNNFKISRAKDGSAVQNYILGENFALKI